MRHDVFRFASGRALQCILFCMHMKLVACHVMYISETTNESVRQMRENSCLKLILGVLHENSLKTGDRAARQQAMGEKGGGAGGIRDSFLFPLPSSSPALFPSLCST